MLARFRIDYSEVVVLPMPMLSWAADDISKAEFESMIVGAGIDDAEVEYEKEKTNR